MWRPVGLIVAGVISAFGFIFVAACLVDLCATLTDRRHHGED